MNKLFPIGTVVKLKDIEKPFMIISIITKDFTDTNYTYSAVPFPLGYLDYNQKQYFNSDGIEEVLFIGYLDRESKNYLNKLEKENNIWKN